MGFLTALALVTLGGGSAPAADVTVTLPANASVGGLEIHVADVAIAVTGADAEAQGLGTLNCHVPPMAFGGPPSPTGWRLRTTRSSGEAW